MPPFSLFLALKYLRPKRSFVSVVTFISVSGVLLGVAILLIVMSVMEGFDQMWRDKILGFSAHITVTRPGTVIDNEDAVALELESIPGISNAIPFVQCIALLRNESRIDAVLIMGVDPSRSGLASSIPSNMISGAFDISDENVVIGSDLAAQLGAGVGDRVLAYSPNSVGSGDELHLPEELTVAGIFNLGMWEFDSRYVLSSIQAARDVYGIDNGAVAIKVLTDDPFRADEFAAAIRETLGNRFIATTWTQMNRTLFEALRVEKGLMLFLLSLISIVAFFCVASTLIVITVQKTSEIGLLKALGFSSGKIMGVFIWHGMIQCITGTLGGLGAGMVILRYRNAILNLLARLFNFELFPKSLYQLAEIPAKTTCEDVVTIVVLVVVFCIIASIVPAARAAYLNPADALRNE
ncbi:MAG: FtsX-like permease family protein [Lentisphaerales bacterium]|nr:MAG: FtsX-like permease family protein [Lentisphaerales bacterium]